INSVRSPTERARQSGSAALAAATAASTSATPDNGTRAKTSPLAGLVTSRRPDACAGTQRPPTQFARIRVVFSAFVPVIVVLSTAVRVFVSVVIVTLPVPPAIRFPSPARKRAHYKASRTARRPQLFGFTTFCGTATAPTWPGWAEERG